MASASPSRHRELRKALTLAALRAGYTLGAQLAPAATARHAARLFCTPFTSSRERARAAPDGGAERSWLNVDGDRLAVYRWGDPFTEPYVLLAHGWSSFALRFLPWVTRLRAAGYAVVGFDQPGHGFSEGRRCTLPHFARSITRVAAAHGPAAAIIGHSLGGAATTVALADGTRAERAILIAPAADPVAATQRFARLVSLVPGMLPPLHAALVARTDVPFEHLQAHRRAPSLAVPALIAHDLEDAEVPWDEGERYARYWPGARLLTTRGLGHSRIVTDPAVMDAGMAFLRGDTVGERVVSSPNLPFGIA